MTKTKRTDSWNATISIQIPISADDPSTATAAKNAVEALVAALPANAVAEIVRSGFGKMEVPAHRPVNLAQDVKPSEPSEPQDIGDIPASLDRRVPRP